MYTKEVIESVKTQTDNNLHGSDLFHWFIEKIHSNY